MARLMRPMKLLPVFVISILALASILSFKRERHVSIILTAFGGINDKGEMWGEAEPFLKSIRSLENRSNIFAFCDQLFTGSLFKHPVVVAVTGMGTDAAATCMQEILFHYKHGMKEVIWSGIGGITPQKGGVYDKEGIRRKEGEPIYLGDLCVSPNAYNYDLHHSSVTDWGSTGTWHQPGNGWWKTRWNNRNLYASGSTTLADEVIAAAKQVQWPEMPEVIRQKIEMYHPAFSGRSPKIFNYDECAEVSSNTYWHGIPEDELARQYVASLIEKVRGVSKTANETVALTSMEAVSWMNVLEEWNERYRTSIPFVNIRSASNYDQPPAGPSLRPILSAQESLNKGYDLGGKEYAIETAALPVLKMFELRTD